MTQAVAIANLSHRYGEVQALVDMSLAIPRGGTVGLIGPDGVGKSTLLSLIAGVRVIQGGVVRVLGGDMADSKTRQALSYRIAYMPQGLGKNLYPTLSVYENIDFHARLFGLKAMVRQARIARLLEATGLSPFPDRAAGNLSGGMKQKLSLCCALVHSPELLILDEPTTGVDPLSRRQFWALVNALRAEQPDMTVIVATAYIDEAEQFECLLAMDDGRLLVSRPTREVMAEYRAKTLEEAYIAMLPPEKQQGAGILEMRPFVPEPDAPPVMEAHGLTKRFGDFTAVDHVSFTIQKGEIFGFLGSNGCGKSTTMKMLTGLLDATEGTAELLGHPVDASDKATRMRVGYMSQAFSLYEELTVRQNLTLHARLYQMGAKGAAAVVDALRQFDLQDVAEALPASLPLGIRQRLQLAAACLHKPEVLILDEPTSGVDPAARDMFWRTLLKLSREDRITIFVSTHFMNEVERCDRISLMHQGRVLAVGTPAELLAQSGQANTEEAFIYYLERDAERDTTDNRTRGQTEASGGSVAARSDNIAAGQAVDLPPTSFRQPQTVPAAVALDVADGARARRISVDPASAGAAGGISSNGLNADAPSEDVATDTLRYWLATVWTFAAREAKELLRDKIRLFFAVAGPVIMLAAVGWSISFDVSNLRYAVLDRDQSAESRRLIEYFRGSPYFRERHPVHSLREAEARLKRNAVALVIDIPPDFGRSVAQGRQPEIGIYADGTLPFNASNAVAYANALIVRYNGEALKERGVEIPPTAVIVPRYMYNQDFRSINAIVPSVLMLVLVMIPAIMTALSVVREREIGSIANLYASPASVSQYLIGKQIPYLATGVVNFAVLTLMVVFWFGVPLKGSWIALLAGTMLLVLASSALGLLISSFTKSQTAAFFIAAIGTLIPAVNFSGLMYPVSSMSGGAYAIGVGFPASWYQRVSIGGFTKGLGLADFGMEFAMLVIFGMVYLALACVFLKKQET